MNVPSAVGAGAAREARYFEMAFEHGLTQLALLDRDFNFIRVNAAYARGAGRPADAFPGLNHFDLFPSDARAIFEQVLRTGRPHVAYARPFTYADDPGRGTTYWDWILLPITDEAGEVEALLLSLNDVTEQEQAARALAHSEADYRTLAENLPDIIARFDREGRHLYVNRAVEAATGLPARAFLGRTNVEAGVPLERGRKWEEALRSVFTTARPCSVEMEFVTAGGVRVYQTHMVPEFGPDGRVQTALSITRDLTEQRDAAASLAQAEARFRSLIEHSSDLIAILDAEGRMRYAGPSFERILGYRPGDLVGTDGFALVHPDDLAMVRATFAAALARRPASTRAEYRCRHRDGSWRSLESTATNLLDDAAVGGVVVNSRDVTERLRLQEQYLQAQKMEATGKLAGGIAHDFNNLLSVIRVNAGLLAEELGPEDPRRADVCDIAAAADQASSLTRQLLAFSRRQVLQPRLLDVGTVLAGMESMLRRVIGEDVEMVTRRGDGPLPPRVRVDPGQLEQIIVNLCVNARQAMPDGGRLTLAVETEADVPGGTEPAWVRLEVRDTGVGMSAEVQRRIFEPFFTTKASGTGLGLATVYGIVEQSGGRITVESAPGRGTAFTIRLPWVEGEPAPPASAPPTATLRARPGETVLVAEDAAAIRGAARRALERYGYGVVEAADGHAALRLVGDAPQVDLVLTDVVMPQMTGLELADAIARRHPGLPVLLMTGYADAVSADGASDTHGRGLLLKPFTAESVARRVRDALDEAAAKGPRAARP